MYTNLKQRVAGSIPAGPTSFGARDLRAYSQIWGYVPVARAVMLQIQQHNSARRR